MKHLNLLVVVFCVLMTGLMGACPADVGTVIPPIVIPPSEEGVCRIKIDFCDVDVAICATGSYAQYCEVASVGGVQSCSFKTSSPNPCIDIKAKQECEAFVANDAALCAWNVSN